jgi:hypothetical protein
MVPVLLNCLPIQSSGCRDNVHAPIFDRKLKLPVNQLSFVYAVHSKKTEKRTGSEMPPACRHASAHVIDIDIRAP